MENYWAGHLEALADLNQPVAAIRSLENIVMEEVGALLFTVMLHDFKDGRARRVYSNRPDVYPVGGWKPIQDNRYSQAVLEQREPFVNRNIEDVREVFFDHETIEALGCESSCHIPVVVEGSILGVYNMLHVSEYYSSDRLQRALDVRPFAVGPIFLARKHLGVW